MPHRRGGRATEWKWWLGHRFDGDTSGPMFLRRVPCPKCGDQPFVIGENQGGGDVETIVTLCPECGGVVQIELQEPHPFRRGGPDAYCTLCRLPESYEVHAAEFRPEET